MVRTIARALLAAVAVSGCGAAPPQPGSFQPAVRNAAPAVDLSKWNDPALWQKQDGYANGGGFAVGWRADHARVARGVLDIVLDDRPCPAGCSKQPYASDELDSTARYRYGTYAVRMQTAKASGVVSTFFTYVNLTPGGKETNDEIDVEIPGARTRTLEATYYRSGGPGVEHTIALPFDSSAAMHDYAIRWLPREIDWIVDGAVLYTVRAAPSALPSHPSNFVLNFWTGDTPGIIGWLGPFHYAHPLHARYASATFTPAR